MRRRSERKKSTDVIYSPAATTTSRRGRRSARKSPEPEVEADRTEEETELNSEEENVKAEAVNNSENEEEPTNNKRRSTRQRTPIKDRSSPAMSRRSIILRGVSPEATKIDSIPEEENGTETAVGDVNDNNCVQESNQREDLEEQPKQKEMVSEENPPEEVTQVVQMEEPTQDLAKIEVKDDKDSSQSSAQSANEEEVKIKTLDVTENSTQHPNKEMEEEEEEQATAHAEPASTPGPIAKVQLETPSKEEDDREEGEITADSPVPDISTFKSNQANGRHESEIVSMIKPASSRKRKWITKRATTENKTSVLSISTDSLKNLIADVHPVPLSDVQLESSSDVEELGSEREEGEKTPSPERERNRPLFERSISTCSNTTDSKTSHKRTQNDVKSPQDQAEKISGTDALKKVHRSPSPARHQSSCVLYITNLVRPFTVLQLKGLLARTGKIVEKDGFWIDRIKSKCYVQYENEDEAIETRHALHGVRWPVSNPKCLNVDFGKKDDMKRAILSTMDTMPKFGQDNNKDNLIVSGGWTRERNEEEKKSSRPVREWDVGKKESLDREKNRSAEKRRSRERDISSGNRENDKTDKGKRNRSKNRDVRSASVSPARKIKKKENDPPLRLLDDLFRKTKTTPCIYWLPLTPEQIAEKEINRQKRIEEHKQRVKQRELEREKEREKEKAREVEREKDRDKRNRSSDRRRSRSRDRRRY